jgi:hypothetical protein
MVEPLSQRLCARKWKINSNYQILLPGQGRTFRGCNPPRIENHKKSVPVLIVLMKTVSKVGSEFLLWDLNCLIHKPHMSCIDSSIFSSKFFNSVPKSVEFENGISEPQFCIFSWGSMPPSLPRSYYATLLQLSEYLKS